MNLKLVIQIGKKINVEFPVTMNYNHIELAKVYKKRRTIKAHSFLNMLYVFPNF